MMVRDLNAQVRANGGEPSPAARRLLFALHTANVRAEEQPGFPAETAQLPSGSVEIGTGEAAALLGCTPQYVRRLARAGRIRARRCGPAWLINTASLNAYRHGGSPCPTPSQMSAPQPVPR